MHIQKHFLVALPENYIYQDELAVLLVRVALPVLLGVFFRGFISTSCANITHLSVPVRVAYFLRIYCGTSADLLVRVAPLLRICYGNLAEFASVRASRRDIGGCKRGYVDLQAITVSCV